MSTPPDAVPSPSAGTPRPRRILRPWLAFGLVALAIIVIVVGVLAKLHTSSAPQLPTLAASQTLSLAMTLDGTDTFAISTLDPAQANDPTAIQLSHLLFDGLVTLDDANNVELWGADHLAISPDGLTYTFHLRPGQSFSNGTPVKPSDYAWSLDRALNPCLAAPLSDEFILHGGEGLLRDSGMYLNEQCGGDGATPNGAIKTLIGDSILPDDSAGTLTLLLSHPAAYLLDVLTLPLASVVDRRAISGVGVNGNWLNAYYSGAADGGSGMFSLASWDNANTLVLKTNPRWWGRTLGKRPHFSKLNVSIFPYGEDGYHAYASKITDYLNVLPPGDLANARISADFRLVPSLEVSSIGFNWHLAPFDNPDARQAFCLAINRDALKTAVQGVAPNTLIAPSWHLVPQGMPGYDPQLTGVDGVTSPDGDLVKAQAHWAAYLATLHGKPAPAIQYNSYPGSTARRALGDALIAKWSAAFPGVQIAEAAYPTFPGILYTPYDSPAFRFAWLADYPDPADLLSLIYSTGSPYNPSGASVPAADALMAAADQIGDPSRQDARMSAYHQAEQDLVQQVATCPLFQYQSDYLMRPYVVGMRQSGLGLFADDDWLAGYIARH